MNVMKGKHSRGLSTLLSLILALTMLLPTGFAQTASAEDGDGLKVILCDNDSWEEIGEITNQTILDKEGFIEFKIYNDEGQRIDVENCDTGGTDNDWYIEDEDEGVYCLDFLHLVFGQEIPVTVETAEGNVQFTVVQLVPGNFGSQKRLRVGEEVGNWTVRFSTQDPKAASDKAYQSLADSMYIAESSNPAVVDANDVTWENTGNAIELHFTPKQPTAAGEVVQLKIKVKLGDFDLDYDTVKFTVLAGATLSPHQIISGLNQEHPLTYTAFPQSVNQTCQFESSDESIATVTEDGVVKTGSTAGKATITATNTDTSLGDDYTKQCEVIVLEDGVYRVDKNYSGQRDALIELLLKSEPVDSVELSGADDTFEYVPFFAGKGLYSGDILGYTNNNTVIHRENSFCFSPVANGTTTISFYNPTKNEGETYPSDRDLVKEITVTVLGMPTDAPNTNDTWTSIEGAQSNGMDSSILLKGLEATVNPTNDAKIDNYITPAQKRKNLTFDFQIKNTAAKSEGGSGQTTSDDAIANLESEAYAAAYAEKLGQYVKLIDADGNVVADGESGLTITARTGLDGKNPAADVTIAIDKDLELNKPLGYTLVFDCYAPIPNADETITFDHPGFQRPVSYTFSTAKGDIADCTVDPVSDQTYTGKAIKPALTVKDGGKTLKEGTDYTVEYKNNTAVGTAIATIKGMGNYEGTQEVTFKIVEKKDNSSDNNSTDSKDNNPNDTDKDKDNSTNKVTVGKTKMGTTGFYKAKAIKVKVKKKAKNATIYKYSIRKASATKWANKWSKKKNYKFKKLKNKELYQLKVAGYSKKNGIKGDDSKISYRYMSAVTKKAKGGKKKVTVTWKKDSKASGYEIRYATSKKALKNAMITKISKGKTKKVIKNLKKGKKYYVQVRPYKNHKGHKYNGIWWTKSAKTK